MSEKDKEKLSAPDEFERELATDLDDDTADKPSGMALHTKILIGLLVGVIAGLIVNQTVGGEQINRVIKNFTEPIGTIFLNLLLMIVVPLVFSSLVVGVSGIGDVRKLGRIGLKSFGYCLIISAISVVIGLGLANTIQPGKRIDPAVAERMQQQYG
nr:cation:dicarboxylase symporter family transporter [Pyrinomonadaceae bacterium]